MRARPPRYRIQIDTRIDPPRWAVLERQLLADNVPACREFFDKYFDDRGRLQCFVRWGANDGPDDAFENFNRWPELHALGASDEILRMYTQGHEGLIRQYTDARTTEVPIARQGMYHKEFIVQSDWMHHGEGLQLFNRMGLSIPADATYQERARRFAGFYMAEDPDAPNYDPAHKIIRSMQNGSRGPMLRPATALDWVGDPFDVKSFDAEHGESYVRAVPRALRRIHGRRRRPLPEPGGDDAADQRVSADRRSEVPGAGSSTTWTRGSSGCARTAASSRATSDLDGRSAAQTADGGAAPTAGDSARSIR